MENINNNLENLSNVIDLAMNESNQLINNNFNVGLFTIKTASEWIEEAKNRPIPKMLFGEFWFEGEVCILFSDTNLGKSILAVQIGNSISKKEGIKGFTLEAPKQSILYFDFELSDKQFENRYSTDYAEHYGFDNNFIRIEMNSDAMLPDGKSFEDFLIYSLEQSIIKTNAKVIILDNITFLKSGTESAKDALPLMKDLKSLKNKYGLSILVLAHTPKRDLSKAISRNDLAGSKMLINFCDSSFTIGESSKDKNLRYIKQIKQRNTENIYNAENVCICEITKQQSFLGFELIDYGSESEHLKTITKQDRDDIIEQVKLLSSEGKSQREIHKELGISLGTVNNYIRK
jgi:RecA-family ATPase